MPTHSDLMECIREIRAENILLRDALLTMMKVHPACTNVDQTAAAIKAHAALDYTPPRSAP